MYRLMFSTYAKVLVEEDKILLVDGSKARPLLEIRFYRYEDGYCISVYKRINSTLFSVCRFKGEVKIEDNKIVLIDFYQVPPIRPALFILFNGNGKVEVYIRRDIEDFFGCPLPPDVSPRSWVEALYEHARKNKH